MDQTKDKLWVGISSQLSADAATFSDCSATALAAASESPLVQMNTNLAYNTPTNFTNKFGGVGPLSLQCNRKNEELLLQPQTNLEQINAPVECSQQPVPFKEMSHRAWRRKMHRDRMKLLKKQNLYIPAAKRFLNNQQPYFRTDKNMKLDRFTIVPEAKPAEDSNAVITAEGVHSNNLQRVCSDESTTPPVSKRMQNVDETLEVFANIAMEDLNVAILDSSHPLGKISGEHQKVLKEELMAGFLASLGSNQNFIPEYESSGFVDDIYRVSCTNEGSLDFLRQRVEALPTARLWAGASLSVVGLKEVPRLHKISLCVPEADFDVQRVLDFVRLQNPGLNTLLWSVIHREVKQNQGQILVIGVDSASLEIIKRNGHVRWFLTTLKVRVAVAKTVKVATSKEHVDTGECTSVKLKAEETGYKSQLFEEWSNDSSMFCLLEDSKTVVHAVSEEFTDEDDCILIEDDDLPVQI